MQYTLGNLRIDGEYRRDFRTQLVGGSPAMKGVAAAPRITAIGWDNRGWYTAAAYRLSKRVEVGAYCSWFIPSWGKSRDTNDNHLYDKVATVRFDLTETGTSRSRSTSWMDMAPSIQHEGSTTLQGQDRCRVHSSRRPTCWWFAPGGTSKKRGTGEQS